MFWKRAAVRLVMAAVGPLTVMGCDRSTVDARIVPMASLQDVEPGVLQKLSSRTVYFGHQSVGGNLVDGMTKLMTRDPRLKLNIVKTDDPQNITGGMFAHSDIGENGNPASKIAAFKAKLQNGIGDKSDVAFFKFCFWDIRAHTDVHKVFSDYQRTIAELREAYPRLKIVHFTVPLVSYPNGVYPRIRRMLGLPVGFDQDNIKRNELNRLIRSEYAGREPLVDIARYESTLPDGTRAVFVEGGQEYEHLAAANTDDGGHLNRDARVRAAEQLLITLVQVVEGDAK